MPELFWKQWEFTDKKQTAPVFHVPSADAGIVFKVTAELAGSCSRHLEGRALTVTLGAVVETVAPIAKRFDVLCADACAAVANRACLAIRKPHRQLRVHTIALSFSSARPHIEAAAHLSVLRRIAAVAGREAVEAAASAYALQQVVLDNHAATVAHLLLTRAPEKQGDLAGDAADLVRGIEDLRPSQRWIRVIEAITSLRHRHEPADIRKMATDLAKWARLHDALLAQTLQDAVVDEAVDLHAAAEPDGHIQEGGDPSDAR